jgi:hypothetical protein
MTVDPVTLADTYDLIVEYANIADPSITWRNGYTFHSDTVPVFGVNITTALGTFARTLCHDDAQIIAYSLYNWARGRQPYPTGEAIWIVAAAASGTALTHWNPPIDSDYIPNNGTVCLRIDHQATPGKPGRTFVRALLGEGDVSAVSGGRPVLSAGAADWDTQLQAVLTATGLSTYMGAGASGQHLCVVRYSPKTGIVHGSSPTTAFHAIGATTSKKSRRT